LNGKKARKLRKQLGLTKERKYFRLKKSGARVADPARQHYQEEKKK